MKKTDNDNDADIIQLSEKRQPVHTPIAPEEIIIGTITAIDELGQPRVDFPENTAEHAVVAVTTRVLSQQHIGRKAALLFTNGHGEGNVKTPVIMGLLRSPLQEILDNYDPSETADPIEINDNPVEIKGDFTGEDIEIDGRRVLRAEEEFVFECGESSLTLTKSGKIIIRGKHLINHATGINWIMGGAIQLN